MDKTQSDEPGAASAVHDTTAKVGLDNTLAALWANLEAGN